jgi:type I restriction enzyme M protein
MAKKKKGNNRNGNGQGNGNGKKLPTQQSVNSAVKAICDIMRRSNCAGACSTCPS